MASNSRRINFNATDMPYANRKIYELIQSETDGNVRAFAKSINVSQQSLNRIFCIDKRNGKYPSISNDIKQGIINVYGKDEIWFIADSNSIENSIVKNDTAFLSPSKDIKILDIRVCAGIGIGFDGDENKIVGYMNIPDFSGCYGITVYGDSMYDMYMPGDTIFVREIKDKSLIDNGQPYVVITREDRLLKMVYVEENGLRLVSYNTVCNPDGRRKYPDMLIEGEQILYLYKVVGKLARNQM